MAGKTEGKKPTAISHPAGQEFDIGKGSIVLNQVRKRAYIVVPVVIVSITIAALFGITVSGTIVTATSPYTIQQVTNTMNSTNHIRLVNYLGQTPDGKTIFTYRWVNYGFLTALRANSENSQIKKALSINRVD